MTLTAGNASGNAGRASEGIDPSGLFDLVSDLVLVSSPNGLVRYANQAWRDSLDLDSAGSERVEAMLYRLPDAATPYRRVSVSVPGS